MDAVKRELTAATDPALFIAPIVGGSDRIPTWGADGGLNRQIVTKLQDMVTGFKQAGIDWTFGREQEFTLRPLGRIDQEAFRKSKVEAITPALEQRMIERKIDAPGRTMLLNAFAKMPLQEVFMTDLHLRLKDDLEPRFGKGASGFYDPQGVLEASTKPSDPVGDVARWHKFTRTLQELATEYDYGIAYYKRDITFKATDSKTGKPLFQTSAAEGPDPRGPQMAAGIQRVAFDALPVFMKPLQVSDHIHQIDTGYGRHHAIRSQQDRLEMRTNHNPMAGAHPALENLLILAGAQFGLSQPNADLKPVTYAPKTVFTVPHKLFFLGELLNASTVQPEGGLRLPSMRLYMKYHQYLTKELALRDDAHLLGWLGKAKVGSQGITWPPAAEVSNNPAALAKDLAKVTYGTTVQRLHSTGYLSDHHGGGDTADINASRRVRMQTALGVMAQSAILPAMLGQSLSNEINGAHKLLHAPLPASGPAPERRDNNDARAGLDSPVC